MRVLQRDLSLADAAEAMEDQRLKTATRRARSSSRSFRRSLFRPVKLTLRVGMFWTRARSLPG